MINNNPQENSKTFEEAVDLLANILVDIIDSNIEDITRVSSIEELLNNNQANHEKN